MMNQQIESKGDRRRRVTPSWVRIVVWVSIAFLTMSVIAGMFLY